MGTSTKRSAPLAVPPGVEIRGAATPRSADVLTTEALAFLADLHRTFDARRRDLLAARARRQAALDKGERPDFLAATKAVREGSWNVAPAPEALQDRRVEITGPVDRKMMINALNSGAKVFMADFEDANAPTWENVVVGQANLMDALDGTLALTQGEKEYRLGDDLATLVVRPRGWHLPEAHVRVDGQPLSASLMDAGLALFHGATRYRRPNTGPWFYLPKLESHLEARLWNDVLAYAEGQLGLAKGAAKGTVLIETIVAAFEMEEILHELRARSAGLNAGRWDYIFSVIKKLRGDASFLLPDRGAVTMDVPFMRAYSALLVQTCHRRGAHAIGGMAAFIPNRRDPDVTERALRKVREDKEREAKQGFDGTWVAHPDLVPVAKEIFDRHLGARPNQLHHPGPPARVAAQDLLDVRIAGAAVTEAGLRQNVSVGLRYIEAWLGGAGAVALDNLMEDAATAEISRSQLWQWVKHGARLPDGQAVTAERVRRLLDDEARRLAAGRSAADAARLSDARAVFEAVALAPAFPEFLTLPAYERLTRKDTP